MAGRSAGIGAVLITMLVVASGVLLSACGSSSSSSVSFTGDAYPSVDLANTRHVGGPIDSKNVSQLKVAWTLPLEAKSTYGSYSASPVVAKGVVYSQDLASNVQAIDLESGDVLWEKEYEEPDQGPNGVTVAEGRVYGATSKAAFALDQENGEELWSVPLTNNEHEGIDMAPGVDEGIVYVSTVPGNATEFYEGQGVGVLWALDAKTGKKLWHFNTVPPDLWEKKNFNINSGGGLWYAPAFDGKGSMYFGVGNPAPFPGTGKYPWGSSRPGPNLYTDSIVKMNAKTGKMDWHFQLTPHDIYDWDLQGPPILNKSGGRELLLAAGKSGIVIALDPQSGKLVWKRSVGTHNGHDNDGLYAMRHEYSKLKTPFTLFPGNLGGVIAPMFNRRHRRLRAGGQPLGDDRLALGSDRRKPADRRTGRARREDRRGRVEARILLRRVRRHQLGQRRRLHHHLRRERVRLRREERPAALAGNAAGRQQHRPHRLRRHRDRPGRPRGRRRPDAGDGRLPPRRLRRG